MGVSENGQFSNGQSSKPDTINRKHKLADQISLLKEELSWSLLKGDEEAIRKKADKMSFPVDDMMKAKSWLMSEFPDIYQAYEEAPKADFRLLLDENLPYSLAPNLQKYGYVSSVFLKGLRGKPDAYLYSYARIRDHFDAIITHDMAQKSWRVGKDRDLTNKALDDVKSFLRGFRKSDIKISGVKKFPLIIHLPSKHPYRDATVKTFDTHFKQICDYIENREFQVINVKPGLVYPNENTRLTTLWEMTHKPKDEVFDVVPTEAAKIIKYSNKVAQQKNKNIKRMMKFVKSEVVHDFNALVEGDADITQAAVLDLMDQIVERVRQNFNTVEDRDGLLVLEMVIKSIEKSSLDISSVAERDYQLH